jgi:hypothetical protein
MKTAAQLVEDRHSSAEEFGRRVTSLRRLASGLKNQPAQSLGLNQKEIKLLVNAAALLDDLATANAKAKIIASKRNAEKQRREQAILAAMKGTFGTIKTVSEKVALVALEKPYLLMDGEFNVITKSLSYIERLVADAIEDMAADLARQKTDTAPVDLVAQAWAKFEKARPAIEAKQRELIDRLSAEARQG